MPTASHESLSTVAPRKSPGTLFVRQVFSAPADYRFFLVLLLLFILAVAHGSDSLPRGMPPLDPRYAHAAAGRGVLESEDLLETDGYAAAPTESGETTAELPQAEQEPVSLDFLTAARSTDLFTTTNTAPSLDELFSSEFGDWPLADEAHSYSNETAAALNRTTLPGRLEDAEETPYFAAQGLAEPPAEESRDEGEVTPSHSRDVSSAFSDSWRVPGPTLRHQDGVPEQESLSTSTTAERELLTDPHLLLAVPRSESQFTDPIGVDAAAGATDEGAGLQTAAQAAKQAQSVAPTESQKTPNHSDDVPSAFSDSGIVPAPRPSHRGGVPEQDSFSKSRLVEGELLTYPHLLPKVGSESPFTDHTGVAPTAGAVEVSEGAVLQTRGQAAKQAHSTASTISQSTVVQENAGGAVQGTISEKSAAQDLESARARDDEITGPGKVGDLFEAPSRRSEKRGRSSLRPVPSRAHRKGRRSGPVQAPKQHKKHWRLLAALAGLALSAGGAYYYSKGYRRADEQD